MNRLCNLDNVVYQGTIYPKETDKNTIQKLIQGSYRWNGSLGLIITIIDSLMSIWKSKQPHPKTFGNWEIRV